MSTQYKPWQFDWKRPQWKSTESSHHGRAIHHAAAAVDVSESPSPGLLTVTLLATPHAGDKSTLADAVLLELFDEETSLVKSRLLRWPAGVLHPPGFSTNKRTWKPWRRWRRQRISSDNTDVPAEGSSVTTSEDGPETVMDRPSGLVAVAWARLPHEAAAARWQDAMDMVGLLSLGGGGTGPEEPVSHPPPREDELTGTAPAPPSRTDLVLGCLSNTGRVYVYSPWSLLQSSSDGPLQATESLEDGMAAMLLGTDMFDMVQDSILPLSRPLHTLELSVHMSRQRRQVGKVERLASQPHTIGEEYEEAVALDSASSAPSDLREDHSLVSVWDPSVWDCTIEAATLPYQTKFNRATLCVAAYDYLCVAGAGRRRRRRRPPRRPSSVYLDDDHHSTTSSSPERATVRSRTTASSAFRYASSMGATQTTANDDYDGGFVTFFSLSEFSEARTLYLPFLPEEISPFTWGPMKLLLVLGRNGVGAPMDRAVAIRVDSFEIAAVTGGEAPSLAKKLETGAAEMLGSGKVDISIRRFQVIPIPLPDTEDLMPLVVGSTLSTSPPCLAFVFVDDHGGQLSIVQRALRAFELVPAEVVDRNQLADETMVAITTSHSVKQTARISLPHDTVLDSTVTDLWCYQGQGWCLVGIAKHRYFVCWEGATSGQGAYVHEFGQGSENFDNKAFLAPVLPIDPFGQPKPLEDGVPRLMLPFAESLQGATMDGGLQRESVSSNEFSLEGTVLDPIVLEALRSISSQTYIDNIVSQSPPRSPRRSTRSFSHKEKSERLLRQCSSWTKLERTDNEQGQFDVQVPVLSARIGVSSSDHFVLSLRKSTVDNGAATPFQHVLSWMSEKEDYFAAASLALDLLCDAESLRHLWRTFEKIDEEKEGAKLEGLLDGIVPIFGEETSKMSATLTQLADMTVGCLTKGGFAMASTLEKFVEKDQYFDISRTSLILVATAARTVSGDQQTVVAAMGKGYYLDEHHSTNILWPVRCLLKAAVSRDSLPTALLLLNSTIPDELRRRNRSGIAASSMPSIELCSALVSLIVASSADAAELLLSLFDEQTRRPYWDSLKQDTQLHLSLIEIDEKAPLLRQPEVRAWALQELQTNIDAGSDVQSLGMLPTEWLQLVCKACLCNAGCDILSLLRPVEEEASPRSASEEIQVYGTQEQHIRRILAPAQDSGGLDFDLLIASLLLLQSRDQEWLECSLTTTQKFTNAVCSLAGHRAAEEPRFPVDCSTLMRQCTLTHNVHAGAYLIGGKDGMILLCCEALIRELSVSMEDAETFLLTDPMPTCLGTQSTSTFAIHEGHKQTTWLLQEHVLAIRSYADFATGLGRGKVDPIFAARLCFRTWWGLTQNVLDTGTSWLTQWMEDRLEMTPTSASSRHLVCAALGRALIWPDERASSKETTLASRLGISAPFLIRLVQSCCGLTEALPPNETEAALQLLDRQDSALSLATALRYAPNESAIDESFLSAVSYF